MFEDVVCYGYMSVLSKHELFWIKLHTVPPARKKVNIISTKTRIVVMTVRSSLPSFRLWASCTVQETQPLLKVQYNLWDLLTAYQQHKLHNQVEKESWMFSCNKTATLVEIH